MIPTDAHQDADTPPSGCIPTVDLLKVKGVTYEARDGVPGVTYEAGESGDNEAWIPVVSKNTSKE